MVPAEVLNKPGSLEPEEFEIMKDHVHTAVTYLRQELLTGSPKPRRISRCFIMSESMDPVIHSGLSGELISVIGRMSAIVDVYDALTSVGLQKYQEPSVALKNSRNGRLTISMVIWYSALLSVWHLSRRVAGPVGTGLVGIVMDLGEDMLRPILR